MLMIKWQNFKEKPADSGNPALRLLDYFLLDTGYWLLLLPVHVSVLNLRAMPWTKLTGEIFQTYQIKTNAESVN